MVSTVPAVFSECSGLLSLPTHGPILNTSVILCRSWGFDELCSRKLFRTIAEALSEQGFPVLRFDYPGTVDSLDKAEGHGLSDWTAAASAGCDLLKDRAGSGSIIAFGLGLGAIVANALAEERQDIAGLVFAAPVISGRRYLRETSLRAKVIAEGLGLQAEAVPNDPGSIGGLVMPEPLAADLKAAKLETKTTDRSVPTLVLARNTIATDTDLAEQLRSRGVSVTVENFDGYEGLMDNPTLSVMPRSVVGKICSWCSAHFPEEQVQQADIKTDMPARILQGSHFSEEALNLGASSLLYGILCKPEASTPGPVLVFLNAGYDHHGGWARNWVKASRALALEGITSLRFDLANIGDSPPKRNQPDQVLYTDGPINDVSDALNILEAKCGGPIILVGRCSGAYTAFHAAFRDPRIKGVALINQLRFIWDPKESITDPSRMGPRSMADYKKKMVEIDTLKRLLNGNINIRGVLRGLSIHAATKASHLLAPIFPGISKYARFRAECHRMFADLDRREVPIHFLCSEGDESLEQLDLYFGKNHKGLDKYPLVSVTRIPDADHNLTPLPAQAALIRFLKDVAARD